MKNLLEQTLKLLKQVLNFIRRFDERFSVKRVEPPTQKAASCVIIGPIGSGKSALIYSLRRCAQARSYSYHQRYEATVVPENADFKIFEMRLDDFFLYGLQIEATEMKFTRPEFILTVFDQKTKRNLHTRFETFDGGGGLLLEHKEEVLKSAQTEEFQKGYDEARTALEEELDKASAFIICLPIRTTETDSQLTRRHLDALADYIFRFAKEGVYEARRIVVCFTKYELLGESWGRHAFRRLASRSAAREHMRRALRDLRGVYHQLQGFDRAPNRSVWCVPVSTYGFIAGHGGSNYNRRSLSLRTQPHRPGEPSSEDTPYRESVARDHLWHPFLTLDPFIFIALDEDKAPPQHTLIHRLGELGNL